MKFFILFWIFLGFSFLHGMAQTNPSSVNASINSLKFEIDAVTNSFELESIGTRLDEQFDLLSTLPKRDLATDVLAVRIMHLKLQVVHTLYVEDILTNPKIITRTLSRATNTFQKIGVREKIEPQLKMLTWLDSGGFWMELAGLDERKRQLESVLFEKSTLEGNAPSYEQYIELYGTLDFNRTLNSMAVEAYRRLFVLTCLDGDPGAITYFKKRFKEDKASNPLWAKLYNELESSDFFKHFNQQVNSMVDVLNKGYDENATSRYASLLEAPGTTATGAAFVCLQWVLRPYLDVADYEGAINRLDDFKSVFSSGNALFDETKVDFENLRAALSARQSPDLKVEITPLIFNDLEAEARNGEWLNFDFSLNQNIGLFPPTHLSRANIYIGKAIKPGALYGNFMTVERRNNNQLSAFQYRLNARKDNDTELLGFQENDSPIDVSDLFKHTATIKLFQAATIKAEDIYVLDRTGDPKYDAIAFFVTTVQKSGSNLGAYPGITLQNYSGTAYAHGKIHGNSNTDIWYVFRDKKTKGWLEPERLEGGNVNTRYSERTPYYANNRLYFASEGHGSLGGFDVYSISATISGRKVTLGNHVEPMTGFNSSGDELNYRSFWSKTTGEKMEFIATNNSGAFSVVRVSVSMVDNPEIKTGGVSSPPSMELASAISTSVEFQERLIDVPDMMIIKNIKPLVQYRCTTINTMRKGAELIGTVYLADAENNRISILPGAEIELNKTGEDVDGEFYKSRSDGTFSISIDPTQGYRMMVYKKGKDGKVYSFEMDYIEPCESSTNLIRHDVLTKSMADHGKMPLPIFYRYDHYDMHPSLNNLDSVRWYLDRFFNYIWKKDDQTHTLVITSYADYSGDALYNAKLSQQRADAGMDWIHRTYKVPRNQLQRNGLGATQRFNDEVRSLKANALLYSQLLKGKALTGPATVTDPDQRLKMQLNRRTEIVFCLKGQERDCLCEYKMKPPDLTNPTSDCNPQSSPPQNFKK